MEEPVVRAASWNIAAVNNNPFEYWITFPDPAYKEFMNAVENLINNPERDTRINAIFTDSMFSELRAELDDHGIGGLNELERYWTDDYSERMAIQGFLKDKSIGEKRLVSMPDRITNTINLKDGGKCMRPSVINAYRGGCLRSLEAWWVQWKQFMFHTHVAIFTEDPCIREQQLVCGLISPIQRSKYPAITILEQAISVPLQILCLAVLDAIFVHIVNSAAPLKWEEIRTKICNTLIDGKEDGVCRIIEESYSHMDVFFIQEAAALLVQTVLKFPHLQRKFALLKPVNLDCKRNQNSMILVDRQRFREVSAEDVTQQVLDLLAGTFVAPGDLFVVCIEDVQGTRWLLASFHGDSNGLSTQPILRALSESVHTSFADCILLVGVDANTRSVVSDCYHHGVEKFFQFLEEQGMNSLWGTVQDSLIKTTCSARTYLQTQLNKATAWEEVMSTSNVNLKDWILGYKTQIEKITDVQRDNTGSRSYITDLVLPTTTFPSDHAIISAAFHVKVDRCLPSIPVEFGYEQLKRTPSSSKISIKKVTEREKTLYDYWGIGEKPLGLSTLQKGNMRRPSALTFAVSTSLRDNVSELSARDSSGNLEAQVDALCESHYIKLAMNDAGDDLDSRMSTVFRSEDRSIWILFTSRPFSVAMCKRWFQMVIALMMLSFLVDGIKSSRAVLNFTVPKGQHFRFNGLDGLQPINATVDLCNAAAHPLVPVDSLRFQLDGCSISTPSTWLVSNSTIVHSFAKAAGVNGWSFLIVGMPSQESALRYKVEYSLDGSRWSEVKLPNMQVNRWSQRLTRQGGTLVTVDLRPSWQWLAEKCLHHMTVPWFGFAACVLGLYGQGRKATLSMSAGYFSGGTAMLVYATSYFIDDWDEEQQTIFYGESNVPTYKPNYWARAALNFVICIALVKESHVLLDVLTAAFTLQTIAIFPSIMTSMRLHSSESAFASTILAMTRAGLPALLFTILQFARRYTRRWVSSNLVLADKEAFDLKWSEIRPEESGLKALEALSKSIAKNIDASQARQFYDEETSKVESPISPIARILLNLSIKRTFGTAHVQTRKQPVTSLDLLLDQAACLDLFLQQKAKELALVSSGCFAVFDSAGSEGVQTFSKCQVLIQKSDFGKIRWATTKPWDRALEKLVRSYGCDVSRLLDCCRQRIIFDKIDDICTCLKGILDDPELHVVRIKNSLNEGYDSTLSAGFRHVLVNLRIENDATRRLGVGTHVCELQLALSSFAELLTDEVHERYIVLRNCRQSYSVLRRALSAILSAIWLALQPGPTSPQPSKEQYHQANASVSEKFSPSAETQQSFSVLTQKTLRADLDQHQNSNGSIEQKSKAVDEKYQEIRTSADLVSARKKLFKQLFHRTMTQEHNPQVQSDRLLHDAVVRASAGGSMWHSWHPIAMAICSPWFSWVTTIKVMLLLWVLYDSSCKGNVVQRDDLGFGVMELHGGIPRPSPMPDIMWLGILRQGCVYHNETKGISAVVVSTDDEQHPEPSPACASSVTWTWAGFALPHNGLPHESRRVRLDLRIVRAWAAHRVGAAVIEIIGLCLLLGAKVTRVPLRGRWIMAAYMLLVGLVHLSFGVSCLIMERTDLAMLAGAMSLVQIGFAAVLACAEVWLSRWCLLAGMLTLAAFAAYHVRLLGSLETIWSIQNHAAAEGVILVLVAIDCEWRRRRRRVAAERSIEQDKVAQQECWERLVAEDQAGSIDQMRSLVEALALPALGCVRQHRKKNQSKPSVEQLWVQAAGVDLYLEQEVQRWGMAANAPVAVTSPEGDTWAARRGQVAGEGKDGGGVGSGRVRSVESMMDEAVRRRDLDWSAGVDCCCRRLLFDSLAHLAHALALIAHHPAVRLVALANGLDPAYDASHSAGRRELTLSLRLETEQTAALGIDSHVCQLRLLPAPLASLQTEAAEERYRAWRDCRNGP